MVVAAQIYPHYWSNINSQNSAIDVVLIEVPLGTFPKIAMDSQGCDSTKGSYYIVQQVKFDCGF